MSVTTLPDEGDCRTVFELMRRQHTSDIESHEKEFGAEFASTIPRPRRA